MTTKKINDTVRDYHWIINVFVVLCCGIWFLFYNEASNSMEQTEENSRSINNNITRIEVVEKTIDIRFNDIKEDVRDIKRILEKQFKRR